MKKVALIGNPNSGKTTVFNSLTGSAQRVGNYPGVTVSSIEGICKLGTDEIKIIDLPGVYSLSPYTNEEIVTRNIIIEEEPDCLVNIIDATSLERSLYLTTQLLEMDIPIVLALNMADQLEIRGDRLDVKALENQLGLPIVMITSLKDDILKHLVDKTIEVCETQREAFSILKETFLNDVITSMYDAFKNTSLTHKLFHTIKFIESDELEVSTHKELSEIVDNFITSNQDNKQAHDIEAFIADYRYRFIEKALSTSYFKSGKTKKKTSASDKIDKVLTHKFFGIPIFIAVLFLVFNLTFSNNFLFLSPLFKNLDDCFSFISEDSIFNGFIGLFYTSNGLNSPGAILSSLVTGITTLLKNLISIGISAWPNWVKGLILDGVISGVFSIIDFLPQILFLFLLFSVLEDTGYMARIAFILDKPLTKIGLSGRSVMPLLMGFGCSVPAIMSTRTIPDQKERIASIRAIPFFSCGAKLPVITGISGTIAAAFGFLNVDLLTLGFYLFGLLVAIFAIWIMRNTSLKGEISPLVMELPTYRFPQMKSTLMLVWDKAKHFIIKAFTVILASTIVIYFISHFGPNDLGKWGYLETNIQNSILSIVGRFIQSLFKPLGFGIGEYGWVFVVAIITGIIAKENVIATLSALSASILSSVGIVLGNSQNSITTFITELINKESVLYVSMFETNGTFILLSFIAFNLLTVPCIASVISAKQEMKRLPFILSIGFWLLISYVFSSAIFLISAYWYLCFVYLLLALALIIIPILINKKRRVLA